MARRKVTSELVVRDSKSGGQLHSDGRVTHKGDHAPGTLWIVKVSADVRIAMGYQSVGIVVGVEVPWPCRPGHVEDLGPGFKEAYVLLDDELADRARELDPLLKKLIQKYGKRY